MLQSILYISVATEVFTKEALHSLLEKSRSNNVAAGITGMLLYKDGNFMQVIEGEREQVNALHHKIKGDPRHRSVVTLLDGPIATRQFPEWSMGFRDLDAPEDGFPEGYSEFLNTPLTGREFTTDPWLAQKLLVSFKRSI